MGRIVPQINLRAHEQERCGWAVTFDFRTPLRKKYKRIKTYKKILKQKHMSYSSQESNAFTTYFLNKFMTTRKFFYNRQIYLIPHVFKWGRFNHREAHQKNVGLWVREFHSKTRVILLTRGIEKTKRVGLTTDHHGDSIIVKHLFEKKQAN